MNPATRARPARPALLAGLAIAALVISACAGGPGPNWKFAAATNAPATETATASTAPSTAPASPSIVVAPITAGASPTPAASASPSPAAPSAVSDEAATTSTGSGAGAPGLVSVSIVDFAFSPARITVRQGGTVVFRNDGKAPHTVKLDSGESPILQAGASYQQAFPSAGTFAFLCGLHPEMTGEVVVVPGSGAPAAGPSAPAPEPTPTPKPPRTPTPATPQPPAQPAPGAATPGSVRIVDSAFQPSRLGVSVGATVTWSNQDGSRHTVRFGTAESPVLDTGQSYRRTFSSAGTFNYVCGLHDDMTGSIVVSASGGGGGGGGGGSAPAPTPRPTSDPASVVLARLDGYRNLLASAASGGRYEDRVDNLGDLASRVAEEIGEGDRDGALSKAEDLVEDTADAVEDDAMSTIGRRMIDAARAVRDAVAAL